MLKVERPTAQQNLNLITANIALEREGQAQSFFQKLLEPVNFNFDSVGIS